MSEAKINELPDEPIKEPKTVTIEEGNDDSSSDGEDEGVQEGNTTIYPRNEKKARQMIMKLGLQKVEGITRVTMKRPKGVITVYCFSFSLIIIIYIYICYNIYVYYCFRTIIKGILTNFTRFCLLWIIQMCTRPQTTAATLYSVLPRSRT